MADDNNNIQFQVIVNTKDSEGNVKTLKRQINELQAAIERASQNESLINVDGTLKSADEVRKIQNSLISQLNKLDESRIDVANKRANAEIEANRRAANAKLNSDIKLMESAERLTKIEQERQAKILKWSDEYISRGINGNQLEFGGANKQSGYMNPEAVEYYKNAFATLPTKAKDINYRWQENYLQNYGKNMQLYAENAAKLKAEAAQVTARINEMGSAFETTGKKADYLGSFMQKFRSHANWIVAGATIASIYAVPNSIINSLKELEAAMAGVQQVLPSIEHDQQALNQETTAFTNIAKDYGSAVLEVVDAGRSWGRMYKEVENVNYLVSQSTKMAVADNFNLADSVRGLESAMAQFGMKSEKYNDIVNNSNRILDVWTKLSHTAGVSAQDLTQAVERAGSAAYQTGVSFEFFNALVAAGVRNTARTGSEIGQTLKTVFSSIRSDKAVAELQRMGVEVYKIGEDGTKSFRSVQDIILDIALKTQSTTKDVQAMNQAISGGKPKLAA